MKKTAILLSVLLILIRMQKMAYLMGKKSLQKTYPFKKNWALTTLIIWTAFSSFLNEFASRFYFTLNRRFLNFDSVTKTSRYRRKKGAALNSKDALDFRKKIVNSPFEIVLLLTASNVNVSRTIRLGRTGTVNE